MESVRTGRKREEKDQLKVRVEMKTKNIEKVEMKTKNIEKVEMKTKNIEMK